MHVAPRALDLKFGSGGNIHCWHSEKHKNGDRTASVGIWKSTNRVKCFGCDTPTMSVVDLVMNVRAEDAASAANWLGSNFDVKRIPKRRHLEPDRPRNPYR